MDGVDGWRRWWAGFSTQGALTWKSFCVPSSDGDTHSGSFAFRLNSVQNTSGFFVPVSRSRFVAVLLRILLTVWPAACVSVSQSSSSFVMVVYIMTVILKAALTPSLPFILRPKKRREGKREREREIVCLENACMHDVHITGPLPPTQHNHKGLALCSRCHPAWASEGTPVGPGKDTHGTLGPEQRGCRGWPHTNAQRAKYHLNDAYSRQYKTQVFRQTVRE